MRSSLSPRLTATLNVKHRDGLSETTESIPLSEDGSYTFTSTLPFPSSPSSFSSSSSSSAVRKVTTIRAPKKAPIIINLTSADPTLSPFAELPSPNPISHSTSSSPQPRFSSTVPLSSDSSITTRTELAKEVRARIRAQQLQREGEAVWRQQVEASEREVRDMRREVEGLRGALEEEREGGRAVKAALDAADGRVAELRAELERVETSKDGEHAELLSKWEQTISTWESEKREWARSRHEMGQQQAIADLAVSALQSEQVQLQAQLAAACEEKRRMEAQWTDTEGRVTDAVEEARVWQAVIEEERKKTATLTAQLDQLKDSYHTLLITHIHRTEEDSQQQQTAVADTAASAEGEEGRARLSRPSLISPLLSPVEQVQSLVNDEEVELKYPSPAAQHDDAPALDEQITSIIVEQAEQVRQEMAEVNEQLSQSHSALHHHVRKMSQSHEDAQQRLQTELAAYRAQCSSMLVAGAESERKLEAVTAKHGAVWTQLGRTMNSNAALKQDKQRLERQMKEQLQRAEEERAKAAAAFDAELAAKEEAVQKSTAVYMDYLARLTAVQKELATAQEKLREQAAAMERSDAASVALTLQLTGSQQEQQRLLTELAVVQAQLRQRQEEVQQAQREVELVQGELQWAVLASTHSAQTLSSLQASTASTIRQWQSEKRVWEKERSSFVAEREYLHVHLQQAQESREELTESGQEAQQRQEQLEENNRLLRFETEQATHQLLQAHHTIQHQRDVLQRAQARVSDFVLQQTQLRRKLGSIISAEKAEVRAQKRVAGELRGVLRESLAVLAKTEQQRTLAESDVQSLQTERDEFDAVLHGALLELQRKEQTLQEQLLTIQQSHSDQASAAAAAQAREAEFERRLSRGKKDCTELQEVLTDALAELRRTEQAKDEVEVELAEAEDESAGLRRGKEELREVLEQALSTLSRAEDESRSAAELIDSLHKESREYREVYEDCLMELRKKEAAVLKQEAELEELVEDVRLAKQGKAEVAEVLQEAMQALRLVEEEHARGVAENEELVQLISRHEKLHASNDETIARLYQEQSTRSRMEVEQLQAELAQLRQLCTAQQAAIAQLTAVKDQLTALVDRLLQGAADKAREEEAKAEQLRAQADAEVQSGLLHQLNKAHTELVQVEAERLGHADQARELAQRLDDSQHRLTDSEDRLLAMWEEEQRLLAEAADVRGARDAALIAVASLQATRAQFEVEKAQLQVEVKELSAKLLKAGEVEAEMAALQRSRESFIESLLQQCKDVQAQQELERMQRAEDDSTHTALVDALKARVAGLTASLDESEAHLTAAMEDLDASTAQCKSTQTTLAEARQQLDEQHEAVERLTKQKAELDDVLREALTALHKAEMHAAEEREAVKAEKTRMGAVIEGMKERIYGDGRHLNELSSVLRAAFHALTQAERVHVVAMAEVEATSAEVSELREALARADSEAAVAQARLGEAREQLRVSRVRQGEDAQEIARQTEEIGRLRTEVDELRQAMEAAQHAAEDAQTEAAHAEQHAEEVKEELHNTRRRLSAINTEAASTLRVEQESRRKADGLEEQMRALHVQLNESQQKTKEVQAELADAFRMRRLTQEQLERSKDEKDEELKQAQHQMQLLTDSLAKASQAAEDYASQLQEKQAGGEERLADAELQLEAREEEVAALKAALQALEAEFARHNALDHAEMEEQSKRWQQDQDELHAQLEQLKASSELQASELAAEREAGRQAVKASEQKLQALAEQVKAGEASAKAVKAKDKELLQCQEQLRASIVRHEDLVRQLDVAEKAKAADKAMHTKAAQTLSASVAAKDKEVKMLSERIDSLQAEVAALHTHNGGSNDLVLNAIIEAQAGALESQLSTPIPSSPSTPKSAAATAKARKEAREAKEARDAKDAPMLRVQAAAHKKEVATLRLQLEKAVGERRLLEKKGKELEKKLQSLSSLKAQADYRSKDISEQGRSAEQRLGALDAQLQELHKEKAKLTATVAELTSSLQLAHVDLERMAATEREKEERFAVRELKWQEDRGRLEQRIAALHGRAGLRRKKSSNNSVTFRDDSALHVGDLRNEIVELQEENVKLLTTIELLSTHRVVEEEGQHGDEEEEVEEEELTHESAAQSEEVSGTVSMQTESASQQDEEEVHVAEQKPHATSEDQLTA